MSPSSMSSRLPWAAVTFRPTANLRKMSLSQLGHPCPEAGGRSRTKRPRAALDRWKILRDLLVDAWSNPDQDRDEVGRRHLEALSPLERDLIRRMFLNALRVLPIPPDVRADLEGRTVTFDAEEAGVSTGVYLTLSLEHPDGAMEHIRLKTGRSSTTSDEAAVLWRSADDGESFSDLMAWPGEVEPITPPSDLEQRLHCLVEEAPVLHRSGVRPGPTCVWCERSALCGAFPADRVVPTNARTLSLTKTDIEDVERCQRRVAWRRVHGVPRDDGDEVEAAAPLSQGRLFHALVAAAEEADDPEAAAADFLGGVPPSELADLQTMWERHRSLLESEGLSVRATEFPIGATLLEGERAETRGVTVIGFVDLTARDAAAAPVAVELKTGGYGETGIEDDLYTIGMGRWIDPDRPIVIHRHYVRQDPPQCEVVMVSPGERSAAYHRLRQRVSVAHSWDWEDPLQPPYSVGPWCGGCEYRLTCESYR